MTIQSKAKTFVEKNSGGLQKVEYSTARSTVQVFTERWHDQIGWLVLMLEGVPLLGSNSTLAFETIWNFTNKESIVHKINRRLIHNVNHISEFQRRCYQALQFSKRINSLS